MITFKKIASVLSSTAMLTSTVALAAAANYPAPFVQEGTADVAIVWGTNAAAEDIAGVATITDNLYSHVIGSMVGDNRSRSGTSFKGEAAQLFTGGTKLYINDSLNAVKNVITKSDMPILLADDVFSGNVEATYTQTMVLGSNPKIIFDKQPTSDDDPQFVIKTSTSSSEQIYTSTIIFNKAVNFTHPDSKGEDITLFGQKYTVASGTDDSKLVLFKTAEKISLSNSDPSAEVTINNKKYTITLISASGDEASIRVTASDGTSEEKSIKENSSKKIKGVNIAVTDASGTNNVERATIIAGADKITISASPGSSVTYGEEDKNIDGTTTTMTGGTTATTKISVSIYSPDSDKDAIIVGDSLVDPVFGSFRLDFTKLSAAENSASRENIEFIPSGDDKMQVKFTSHQGIEKTIQYAKNFTNIAKLSWDDNGRNISVREGDSIKRNDYVVVGNEDEGYLLKFAQFTNQSGSFSGDKVQFTDVFSGDSYDTTMTAEGEGTLTVGGKSYSVRYSGTSSDDATVVLDYPDSTGSGAMIVYPTIETSKGAKLFFYEPILITSVIRGDRDGIGPGNNLTSIKLPNGDGYTDVGIVQVGPTTVNVTFGNTVTSLNLSSESSSAQGQVGRFNYNFTVRHINGNGTNADIRLALVAPDSGLVITEPAIGIIEERDDNGLYEGVIVTLETGATSEDGIGVNDIIRTWGSDSLWDAIPLASNSKMTKEADLWGLIGTKDNSDSDQATAKLSYPDEQVYIEAYITASDAVASTDDEGGGAGGNLRIAVIPDSEIASVSTKNLIVVGGSCVNSVASSLLNSTSPLCGSDFTAKTGVGTSQFLIETFARSGGKVATLVAGYNVADTKNAVKYLTTQQVATDVGKKYIGTSATEAQLITEGS